MKLILLLLFPLSILLNGDGSDRTYEKVYNDQGNLVAEGWMKNNQKIDYWIIYDQQGNIAEKGRFKKGSKDGYWYYYNQDQFISFQGRYTNGNRSGWWVFNHKNGGVIKLQYTKGEKNGLCLYFSQNENRPYKADRFRMGEHLGSWTSISDFKEDNPDIQLGLWN